MSLDTARLLPAEEASAPLIAALVRRTVEEVYPRYYCREIVDAFRALHTPEAVGEDIRRGGVYGLWLDGMLIGTGTRLDSQITRVYVAPPFQGRGYGSRIMDRLEAEIARSHAAARLEASLPALRMYGRRGYRTVRRGRWPVENGVVLVYDEMEKSLRRESEGAPYGP